MEIKKTSNYDLFKNVNGNRHVNKYHVAQLVRSIEEKDLLEENPIIVNGFMEVIDGQHRLEAAKTLGVPVYYVEREGASLDDIKRLNVTNKAWTISDYLQSFIDQGKEDYMILKEFSETYKLPVTVSLALLTGGGVESASGKGSRTFHFRNGSFKVTHLAGAEGQANALKAIEPYTEGSVWRTKNFIGAMQKVWEKVDKKAFQEKLESSGFRIRARLSKKEYLRDMEDIFNKGRSSNEVRFA